MYPSYIATNQEELFDKSPLEIQELITGGEVEKTTAILGKLYKLPISSYVAFSDVISFILIGALKPEDVLTALEDILKMPPDEAYKLAQDLEKTILQQARLKILNQPSEEMVTLTFEDTDSKKEELRKEILDTTKRESAFVKEQSSLTDNSSTTDDISNTPTTTNTSKKSLTIVPGSHSQLVEQLQILDSIPNDEEIEARLNHIKEQLASIESKGENRDLDSKVALKEFIFGEKSQNEVNAKSKTATYSKAPTSYNIDPYKEAV